MSTHNIHFHDKIGKLPNYPYIFVFSRCRKNFLGTQKRVRINHGKRLVGVRVIEILLYVGYCHCAVVFCYFFSFVFCCFVVVFFALGF